MTNIVLDTNILISAVLTPVGNPAKIIALVSRTKEVQIFYSSAILKEYVTVLSYERLKITAETQSAIIGNLRAFGVLIEPTVSTIPLPDETDRIFYDAAKSSSSFLITGNIKHYPNDPDIITPADFLNRGLSDYRTR